MPKRPDLNSILVIGSGPIVIGQACEFDYSGTQACRALREEGLRVVLVNSNPATIMTDPELAECTYVEPLTVASLEAVIARERPDALLPTVGGQTALNLTLELHQQGILEKYQLELIGAGVDSIKKAEDRKQFHAAMQRIGVSVPQSAIATNVEEGVACARQIGMPVIVRPSFTLGGAGGGAAHSEAELTSLLKLALAASPIRQVLVEKSVLGWKEFEMEVMRDSKDNVVIICSIENFDPMGLHTGDSITVAPAQTLTDREYQHLRDLSIAIIREIGVDTGGSNVQFAVNPQNGDIHVIEMNPRVSRSSALASKATGFPIAKIAAKLAVGFTLDELPNDITRKTSACFEPAIDYVVTKIPRFAFEKFPAAAPQLGIQMKSVGEVMAIGRIFKESLQKALRSLELEQDGLIPPPLPADSSQAEESLKQELASPTSQRLLSLAEAMRRGFSDLQLQQLSGIDPWFINQIRQLVEEESQIASNTLTSIQAEKMRRWKSWGFSDSRLATLLHVKESQVRAYRQKLGVRPVFKKVDTCAAEFQAATPYFYSCYEEENEIITLPGPKAVILGSGPNRIGQGIEFDYCCVHAAFALREAGWKAIMVNCNPETVSTDYDVSHRLYFEPICLEDVLEILEQEKPDGVIIQLGGQTPLKLARDLEAVGVPILGTSYDSIDRTEDRQRFADLVRKLNLLQPENRTASSLEDAQQKAQEIGYPLIVRPSYVLGGRAMEVVRDRADLEGFFNQAMQASPRHPVLLDSFVEDAVEVDVDVLGDGSQALVVGMMEHIEHAGVHSGDSACVLPPHSLSQQLQEKIRKQSELLALELKVVGLMNVQFAVKEQEVFLLEVNPRASRTVPFVSKAVGFPAARLATHLMLGRQLAKDLQRPQPLVPYAVKETVFPFVKLPGVDLILGPEMLSTGEVMGRGDTFAEAFIKSQLAVFPSMRTDGSVFIGVRDADKPRMVPLAKKLQQLGYQLLATRGTRQCLVKAGIQQVREVHMRDQFPGSVFDDLARNQIALVINTTSSDKQRLDPYHLRRMVLNYHIPYYTTLEGAHTMVEALWSMKSQPQLHYTPLSQTFQLQQALSVPGG